MNVSHSRAGWAVAIVLSISAASACSSERDVFVGQDCERGLCDNNETFGGADAGAEASSVSPEGAPMCPVTTCTPPRTTCPTSAFPCDVDLMNDNENCGGCGIRCGTSFESNWRCVEGKCQFACGNAGFGTNYQGADCDHDPTNGCESNTLFDNDNCGGCGYVCPAGKSCLLGQCFSGCDFAAMYMGLPDECSGVCTDLRFDKDNCGTCGTVCDPTGPNLPALPSDMHYGCGGGECGVSKCNDNGKANCNQDKSDGCETTLHTNQNCGFCGDTCAPGKECLPGNDNVYHCFCLDDTETLCGNKCQLLDQDPNNCGACNNLCPGTYSPHFVATCTKGICGGQCEAGYADCDGLPDNGCEIDVRIDNRHCGACGNACSANQVCADGKCQVAPCEGEPETTAK
jgi:hypothetical protein